MVEINKYCIVLYKVVKSFPSNKAPGRDKVSMAVIKDALPCILLTLTEIVNLLLCHLFSQVAGRSQRSFEGRRSRKSH